MRRSLSLTLALLALLASPVWAQDEGVDAPAEGSGVEMESGDLETGEASGAESDEVEVDLEEETEEVAGGPTFPRVGRTPALYGHTGVFYLHAADSTPPGTFSFSLFGQYFSANDVVRLGDSSTRFGGVLGLSGSVHPNVEIFGSLQAAGTTSNFTDPSLIQSVGDATIGGKGYARFGEGDGLGAGGSLTLVFLNSGNDVGYEWKATSADFRGFFTWDLDRSQNIPFVMHFNMAYYLDNSSQLFDLELQREERFAHRISDFNEFELGLGFEFPVQYVTPSLEWRLGIPVGSGDEQECATNPIPCPHDVGASSFPNTLTFGIKGTPVRGLSIDLAVDLSLTSAEATGLPGEPPYNIIFGLAYVVDPRPQEVATDAVALATGWILGEVVDSESGEPIAGALVSYPGTEFTPQSTDPTLGRFRSYDFVPEAEVFVEVQHPEYQTREFTRIIIEGQDAIRVRMERRLDLATLSGHVLDRSGNPLPATIYVTGPGTDMLQFEADPLTSEFGEQLPVGRYVVTIVAADHVSDRRSIELAPGEADLEITLDPLPPTQIAVLRGDRIELEGQRVSFIDNGTELEMESETVLDQVAELMRQHADLNLRVVAHGDDAATVEQTQQQADRVVEYLTDVGIAADRLTPEGAAGERPRFPNITDRNRQRNWRVAFVFR